MPATTPRYAFTYPTATDPTDIPDDVSRFLDQIDAHIVMAFAGTTSARPAPSVFGRRYFASDTGIEYFDTGVQWLASGTINTANGNIVTSAPGDTGLAGGTGFAADAGHRHPREARGTVSDLQPSSQNGSFGATGKWVDAGHSHPGDCIGDLKMSVTGLASVGWLVANGATVSRTTYATFYNAAGGTANYPWGQGDGVTTFNLPNFMDKVPVGSGSLYTVGQIVGTRNTVLTTSQLPTHNHGVNDPGHNHSVADFGHSHGYDLGGAVQFVATSKVPSLAVQLSGSPGAPGTQIITYADLNIHGTPVQNPSSSIGVNGNFTGIGIQNAGGSQAVSLLQPSAGVIYLVKVA